MQASTGSIGAARSSALRQMRIIPAKDASSMGPLGSAMVGRIGTGCLAPVASIAATTPGTSPSAIGLAQRASATIASRSSQTQDSESACVAGGAKALHSIEKPRMATRGGGV
jgi:hypothetical protein